VEKLAVPVNFQHQQEKDPPAAKLKRAAGDFSRGGGHKSVDMHEAVRIELGQMTDSHDLRVRMANQAYCLLVNCSKSLGYTSVAEFVRVAIQEKIRKDCYDMIITVEDIGDLKTKKG
jgi:hypothetical protein